MKAKLVSVQGSDEFQDLIGCEGKLNLPGTGKPHNWFMANGSSISLIPSRISQADGKVKVKTKLGNTFTFQTLTNG